MTLRNRPEVDERGQHQHILRTAGSRSAAALRLVGRGSYDVAAQMTGEDFAFITEALPAAYMHLGIGNETLGTTSELHTPTFRIDESVRGSST